MSRKAFLWELEEIDEPMRSQLGNWASDVWVDDDCMARGPNLVVLGKRGRGKTAAAHAVSRHLRKIEKPYRYCEKTVYTQLSLTIAHESEMAMHFGGRDRVRWFERYVNDEILCIDDFVRKLSPQVSRDIELVVDRRYSDGRPTVITTNATPAELEEIKGPSLADRLLYGHGGTVAVSFLGEDLRRNRRQNALEDRASLPKEDLLSSPRQG